MKLEPAIIAMDLDDTLLRHDLSISDRTVRTLAAARDRGIKISLASGRSPEAPRWAMTRVWPGTWAEAGRAIRLSASASRMRIIPAHYRLQATAA